MEISLRSQLGVGKVPPVITLGEIESAVGQLPPSEQERLLVPVGAQLASGHGDVAAAP